MQTQIELIMHACCECDTRFAMSTSVHRRRKEDGKRFFCPLGHSQVFCETKVKQLEEKIVDMEEELSDERDYANTIRDQRNRIERSRSAYKAWVTKLKKRINGNGTQ